MKNKRKNKKVFVIEKAYDKETALDAISGVLFWDAFKEWLKSSDGQLEVVYNNGKDSFMVDEKFFLNIDDNAFKKAFMIAFNILKNKGEKNEK